MNFIIFLGISAGALHLIAFSIYNKQMLENSSHPNSATWTLWVFLTALNCTSYFFMSTDWVKSFLPLASSIACIATYILALFKGKLKPISSYEAIAFAIGALSGLAWWKHQSASYANLILQFSIFVSFIPTYQGVWENSKTERGLPWFIWSSAYIISIIVIIFRWDDRWQDLVYPINGFFLHMGVGLLTLRKNNLPTS